MNRMITCLLAIVCSVVIAEERNEYPVFKASDTESILAKTGQKITVKGSVSTARKSKSGTNFISFKDSEFYLVTFKSDLNAFKDGEPADLYQKKHLAVTGVISVYKNKPQMKLLRPDMVKIISKEELTIRPEKKKKRESLSRSTVAKISQKSNADKKKRFPPVDPKKYFK